MSVQWTGLSEFKADLRNLPDELADEAGAIVLSHANEAERLIQGAYPLGPTGNLKRGVRMNMEHSGRAGAAAIVRSTAKHSHIFERGTRQRRTDAGANRGRMPEAQPNQQMIPIVVRVRRRMNQQLIHMVQKHGLTVTET